MERVGGCDREKPRSIEREGKLGLGLGEIPPVPVIRAYRTKTINSRSASSRPGKRQRSWTATFPSSINCRWPMLGRCLRVPFHSRGTAVPHRKRARVVSRVTGDEAA